MKKALCLAYISADRGIPLFGHKAGSVHAQEILSAWAKRGASIEIFAAALGDTVDEDFKSATIRNLPSLEVALCGPSAPKLLLRRVAALNQTITRTLMAALNTCSFDIVYERYSLWSYAGMNFARNNAIVSILEVNAPLIQEQNYYRTPISTEAASAVARRAFRSATIILAVSSEIANALEAFPEARKKVLILPNGVNLERFGPKANANIFVKRGEYRIGFVGGDRKSVV